MAISGEGLRTYVIVVIEGVEDIVGQTGQQVDDEP